MPMPNQGMMQQGMVSQGPDQATALFEQGLSEMAYQLLTQRLPDVVPEVVTFKILSTDVDKGYGVGAFVVAHGSQPMYIPVVMSNNAIKPLDVMYLKAQNMFLPLTRGWLDEIDKAGLAPLGQGVKTPETLYTDVDIRNVVVPPITGRFSYAAATEGLRELMAVENLEKTAEGGATLLPKILADAPNAVKIAFKKFLERAPATFKKIAEVYGVSTIAESLRPRLEKVAAKQNWGGGLWIADKDNTPSDFRRIFGDKAGEAYTGIRKRGFAAKDERYQRNVMLKEQPYERWMEPKNPGVYILHGSKGEERAAFVMPNPVDVFDEGTRYGRRPAVRGHHPLVDNSYYDPEPHGSSNKVYPYGRPDEGEYVIHRGYGARPYLAVFGDGSYIEPTKLVGRDSIADSLAGPLHERMFVDVDGAPRAGKGFFVRQKGTTYQATVPMEIKSVTTGADGVRRCTVTMPGGFSEEKVIATDPENGYNTIWMPRGHDVVYLPPDFMWIPLKERLDARGWFQSPLDLASCALHSLDSVGAKRVEVKDAGAKQFSVCGGLPMDKIAALKKIAHEWVVDVEDAWTLLEKAAADGHATAWVASGEQLARAEMKLAADDDKKKSDSKPKKKAPPSGGADDGAGPPGDPGMDPSLGQDAAMAAMGPPPPPPAPSPTELAAMEMDQAIQLEMQKLHDKQQMLATLVGRAHEIAGGAPLGASTQSQMMGAPPASQNLATGAPSSMMPPPPMPGMPGAGGAQGAMDPSMGAAVPPGMPPDGPFPPAAMDPSMMGGMGGMGGAQPPMDPSMMGGAGGMDPSMMGGMGGAGGMGGMDPSMQQGGQPPMGASMPADGPSPHALGQEINPQFLDQAHQLGSADVFDAAAVAMLAQSPQLHAVVGQYLPNLEKSVDNLARVLLTLWMQESDLKERVGEATFDELEQNLQNTFKGMGDLVLRLARGAQGAKEPEVHAEA